ncbi:MAG: hypothetical protein AAGH79_05525 [Bacteroidota bacterium]
MIVSIQHTPGTIKKQFFQIETVCDFVMHYVDVAAKINIYFETVNEQLTYFRYLQDFFDAVSEAQQFSERKWQSSINSLSADFDTAA